MLKKIFNVNGKSGIKKLVAFLIGAMTIASAIIIAKLILRGELINRNLWPTIQIILSASILPILGILLFQLFKKKKRFQ